MRIDYSFWGFLGAGIIDTPDGGRSHRHTLIDGITSLGHQIVFLQPNRDLTEAGEELRGSYTWNPGLPDMAGLPGISLAPTFGVGGAELILQRSDGGWATGRGECGQVLLQAPQHQRAAPRAHRGQPAQRQLRGRHRPVQVTGREVRSGQPHRVTHRNARCGAWIRDAAAKDLFGAVHQGTGVTGGLRCEGERALSQKTLQTGRPEPAQVRRAGIQRAGRVQQGTGLVSGDVEATRIAHRSLSHGESTANAPTSSAGEQTTVGLFDQYFSVSPSQVQCRRGGGREPSGPAKPGQRVLLERDCPRWYRALGVVLHGVGEQFVI